MNIFLTDMLEPRVYWGIVKIYTTDAKRVEMGIVVPHHLKVKATAVT